MLHVPSFDLKYFSKDSVGSQNGMESLVCVQDLEEAIFRLFVSFLVFLYDLRNKTVGASSLL